MKKYTTYPFGTEVEAYLYFLCVRLKLGLKCAYCQGSRVSNKNSSYSSTNKMKTYKCLSPSCGADFTLRTNTFLEKLWLGYKDIFFCLKYLKYNKKLPIHSFMRRAGIHCDRVISLMRNVKKYFALKDPLLMFILNDERVFGPYTHRPNEYYFS